jgi:hypothetical protein
VNDLPPELSARRDAIHDRVIKQGRLRRLQRRLAVAAAIVIAVGLPVAAVGLSARDGATRRVEAVAPRDEVTTTTSSETSTTSSEATVPTTATTIEAPLPMGEISRPYSFTLTPPSGGTPRYTWTATGLPASLTIGSATGTISGTPSVSGTFANVKVTITDANGATATKTFSLVIATVPSNT